MASGGATGSWKKLNEVDNFDYTNKAKNIFGWNDIADDQYRLGNQRTLSGTRVKLTNNGLAPQTDISRLGPIWDTTNNRFVINDLNAFYIVRTQFKAVTAATAGTPYTINLELQTSNGNTVISANTQFIKGGNTINYVSFVSSLYIGSFINNTNLEIYVQPDVSLNIYDIGFVVQRTYKES